MDITVNIATYENRKDSLPKTIESLHNQTVKPDKIRIYDNFQQLDITDRGKFAFLGPNEYYFTCDDDIFYPPTYIERTLAALDRYPKSIVTYHGRRLMGGGLNYYHGHTLYHFLRRLESDIEIDVAGTGVCAFNTNNFMPNILQYEQNCMVDLLLSLEAAKNNTKIMCLAHCGDWFQSLTDGSGSIYRKYAGDCDKQSELADEIIRQS